MAPISLRPQHANKPTRTFLALLCTALLVPGEGILLAQEAAKPAPAAGAEPAAVKIPPDQLDSLVAPIALYPDPLLAQTLVASTYPLEIVQLQQWLAKNPKLKDKALADAVAKQPWDPSIQSMAAVPEVVKRLADDIQWTTQLGDAFLDQQGDVMDAVQRMRKKAEGTGALKSNEQQKVETKVVEEKTVIVVEQTNPEVVYVPSYSPVAVYGPPIYPYPPVYYPPYYAGGALISFGVGMAMGAAIWGGSCCGCGWGGGGNNNININNNNNFNRNNINSGNVNRGQGGSGNWQHNAQHRGGAPYSNKATANKYGGSARGDAGGSRGQGAGGRGASAGSMDRGAGGAGNRGASAGSMDRSAGGGGSRGGGGGDRIGNQSIPSGGGSKGGFGGGSGGYSGSSARASSSRGSSSMSSRGGGGGGSRGGGGGRGGGGRR